MSNDTENYPEDTFKNMISFTKSNNFGELHYLVDETQEIVEKYDDVCTADFFGCNKGLKLQYRVRLRELKDLKLVKNEDSDLKVIIKMMAKTQKATDKLIPSVSCNIKWKF